MALLATFVRLRRFFHANDGNIGVGVVYVLKSMRCHSNMMYIPFLVVVGYDNFLCV